MVWSLSSAKRRRKLAEDAEEARASTYFRRAAWVAVIVYNIVGVTDIASTIIAISSGAGVEANPFLRGLMEHAGEGWVLAKLSLQGLISFMVLWFPHRIVLGFFVLATLGNMWIVYNNFLISGVF